MPALQKISRKWCVLIAMIGSISMLFIDATVLPVTLPTIQRELGLSELGLQWLINAYLLSLTALLIAGGKISDILGRRRVCAMGLIIFSISSVFCAFSHTEEWFIMSRALQGLGAALLLPATNSILLAAFPPEERGRAMGIYLGAGSVFLSMGPFVGGILTEYLNWRYVFWINLPVSILDLVLLFAFVHKSEGNEETFDLPGFLTLAGGMCALVIGMMQLSAWGLSWPIWSLFLISALLFGAFIMIDRSIKHPFVNFSLFSNKRFSAAVICIFIAQFLMMITVFWAIFFQHILGYSPSVAGLITLVANCPIILVAPIAGYLTDKVGARIPAMIGFSFIFIGLLWFHQIENKKDFLSLLPPLVLYGSGIPLVLNPCFVSSMNEIPKQKWGGASALRQTIRQLGATIGMALIGSIFLHRLHLLLAKAFQTDPLTENLSPSAFQGLLSAAPHALDALKDIPRVTANAIEMIYISTYSSAFGFINLLSASLAFIGFFLAAFLLSGKKVHHDVM